VSLHAVAQERPAFQAQIAVVQVWREQPAGPVTLLPDGSAIRRAENDPLRRRPADQEPATVPVLETKARLERRTEDCPLLSAELGRATTC